MQERDQEGTQHVVPRYGDHCGFSCEQWEINNFVLTDDTFLIPNTELMDELHKTQPWKTSPHYFQSVKVSVSAALQMMIHAERGSPNIKFNSVNAAGNPCSSPVPNEPRRENWFEVMGILLGHFNEKELIVTDAFALPVNATEVECSMNEESQLYMLDYLQYHHRGGTQEVCVGWYHSHPGYTCFLSGTDVNTQQLGQSAQDPWLAIVVDPVRTISTGTLDMKAFRTFPEAYALERQETQQQVRDSATGAQRGRVTPSTLLLSERIKEYGVHAHRYYELPITLVRSKTDEAILEGLWSRYWTLTFSTNPLSMNQQLVTQQIHQLVDVLEASARNQRGKVTTDSEYVTENRQSLQKKLRGGDDNNEVDEVFEENEPFKENNIQAHQLTSALVSEVVMGGALMAVKKAVFRA